MKRSESVLVYSVTGVLAVILAVAIVFGDGTPKPVDPNGARIAGIDDGDLIDPADPKESSGGELSLLDELLDGSGEFGEEDPIDPEPQPDPIGAEVPLSMKVAVLGPSRVEENPASGERYRIVEVKRGDFLGGIVQRWCPGVDQEIVAALNETLDPTRLRPGQEVCLPWVDDEILLEAYERRSSAASAAPAIASANPSGAVPAGVSTNYTIKKNESLWVIAARKVGANKAQGYIQQILAQNPSISDASRVREGMKILLP